MTRRLVITNLSNNESEEYVITKKGNHAGHLLGAGESMTLETDTDVTDVEIVKLEDKSKDNYVYRHMIVGQTV